MMGRQTTDQGRFFYDFCLEDHEPGDHLLRRIDSLLDLSEVRRQLKPFYSHTGRPSVDPELMMRMLLIGYCYGIRSERRLCDEVHLNMAYRWFCGLGLEGQVPDHTTFSRNRHGRFRKSDVFRLVFESVVRRCMAEGLVGAVGFAVDASVMEADASRYHGVAGNAEIDWSDPKLNTRAVREYLAALEPTPVENRKPPKVISLSDPCSAWTAKANKRVLFGYGLNYLIDNEHAIIVDVEATPARTYDEVAATKTMLDRTQARFALKPERLAADTAYGRQVPGLAHGTRHHAAHPGLGQEPPQGWHLLTAGLPLRQRRRSLHLPGWQAPAHNRPGPRRPDTFVPGEQTRLPALPVEAPLLP
jgi:transposase